jgi:hypothetical protein
MEPGGAHAGGAEALCARQEKLRGEIPSAGARVEATQAQIDRLMYALYGLTEEEIGIVEGEA